MIILVGLCLSVKRWESRRGLLSLKMTFLEVKSIPLEIMRPHLSSSDVINSTATHQSHSPAGGTLCPHRMASPPTCSTPAA